MDSPAPGIENTKAVLHMLITLVNVIESAEADGKIDLNDAALLFKLVPTLSPGIAGVSHLKSELSALSPEELADLSAFIVGDLAISNAKVTAVIEKGLAAAGALVALVQAIKA